MKKLVITGGQANFQMLLGHFIIYLLMKCMNLNLCFTELERTENFYRWILLIKKIEDIQILKRIITSILNCLQSRFVNNFY